MQADIFSGLNQSPDHDSSLRAPSQVSLAVYSFAADSWSSPDYGWQGRSPGLTTGQSAALLADSNGTEGLYVWGGANYIGGPSGRSQDEQLLRCAYI